MISQREILNTMRKPSGRPRKWSRNGIALEYGELYRPKPLDVASGTVSYGYAQALKYQSPDDIIHE
jgi:hypothetical protein